ncbi:hypothetical protein M426DRAFT_239596 [Hypoxylon sp. CI-4A]|nr:hypothetical protein M426DRAFT_239596 [Hypoxylon sp. CI-4A]
MMVTQETNPFICPASFQSLEYVHFDANNIPHHLRHGVTDWILHSRSWSRGGSGYHGVRFHQLSRCWAYRLSNLTATT